MPSIWSCMRLSSFSVADTSLSCSLGPPGAIAQHPILWHPLGCLQGFQQGDPLGPLLFSLVLVLEITTKSVCAD